MTDAEREAQECNNYRMSKGIYRKGLLRAAEIAIHFDTITFAGKPIAEAIRKEANESNHS